MTTTELPIDEGDIALQQSFLRRMGWHIISPDELWQRRPSLAAPDMAGYIEVHAQYTELTGHAILWYRHGLPIETQHTLLQVAVAVATGQIGPPLDQWPTYLRDLSGRYRYMGLRPPPGVG